MIQSILIILILILIGLFRYRYKLNHIPNILKSYYEDTLSITENNYDKNGNVFHFHISTSDNKITVYNYEMTKPFPTVKEYEIINGDISELIKDYPNIKKDRDKTIEEILNS